MALRLLLAFLATSAEAQLSISPLAAPTSSNEQITLTAPSALPAAARCVFDFVDAEVECARDQVDDSVCRCVAPRSPVHLGQAIVRLIVRVNSSGVDDGTVQLLSNATLTYYNATVPPTLHDEPFVSLGDYCRAGTDVLVRARNLAPTGSILCDWDELGIAPGASTAHVTHPVTGPFNKRARLLRRGAIMAPASTDGHFVLSRMTGTFVNASFGLANETIGVVSCALPPTSLLGDAWVRLSNDGGSRWSQPSAVPFTCHDVRTPPLPLSAAPEALDLALTQGTNGSTVPETWPLV